MNSKKVLVTGASKGIGKAIAEYMADRDYLVYGTSRDIASIGEINNRINYVELDLRDSSSIDKCVRKVGDIDALINNAGIVHFGPFEYIPFEKFREIFEVNFFGTIRLTSYFIEQMRLKRNGTIVNIGSQASKFALPYLSGYIASKYALAGYTWSLRMELKGFNIKVVMIEPSDIKTTMSPEIFLNKKSEYLNNAVRVKEIQDKNMLNAPEPVIVAELLYKILKKRNPKPFYSVGPMSTLITLLKRVLPDIINENIIQKLYRLK